MNLAHWRAKETDHPMSCHNTAYCEPCRVKLDIAPERLVQIQALPVAQKPKVLVGAKVPGHQLNEPPQLQVWGGK